MLELIRELFMLYLEEMWYQAKRPLRYLQGYTCMTHKCNEGHTYETGCLAK